MIKIVSGSVEDARKELKEVRKIKTKESSEIRKEYRKDDIPGHVRYILHENDKFLNYFTVSSMLPVQVAGMIINYHLYQRYMKKLKNFSVDLVVDEWGVTIRYRSNTGVNGELQLFDLSPSFDAIKELKSIPKAELVTLESDQL